MRWVTCAEPPKDGKHRSTAARWRVGGRDWDYARADWSKPTGWWVAWHGPASDFAAMCEVQWLDETDENDGQPPVVQDLFPPWNIPRERT